MRDDLVGYLLGALDTPESKRIEAMLADPASGPPLRRDLEILRRATSPLSSDRDPIAAPSGLAKRTLRMLAEQKSAVPADPVMAGHTATSPHARPAPSRTAAIPSDRRPTPRPERSVVPGDGGERAPGAKGINWHKASEVGMALILSPLIGFALAAGLLVLCKSLIPAKELYQPPDGDKPPPGWIRALLISTCTAVSFAHGSNDGQKGMGLIMLVLIGIVPATYALNLDADRGDLQATVVAAKELKAELEKPDLVLLMTALREQHLANAKVERISRSDVVSAAEASLEHSSLDDLLDPYPQSDIVLATLDPVPLAASVVAALEGRTDFKELSSDDRWNLRTKLVELGASVRTLVRQFGDQITEDRRKILKGLAGKLSKPVEYVPEWVKWGVALCLGLGTMFGWERIVVTVGEKIGKEHLTYAQGGAAELVAATTIAMADKLGMPVSTTHVLSSGIAGTMWANKSGIQAETVKAIALAWVLTLPVAMALSGGLYWVATWFVG